MSAGERRVYILHVGGEGADFGAFNALKGQEGEVLTRSLLDPESRGMFEAKIMLSQTPQEGYDELVLEGGGLARVEGQWYVKILEREEEEEEAVTVFQSLKLSDRRGYMLKSMMGEQKTERKKEIMTTELEEKLRRKREITEKILKEKRE